MHIPDGFIAPQVYLPAYGVAGAAWAISAARLRRSLDERTLPRLAVLTALAFVLTAVAVPLPGGTSVHASGIAILAVLFGVGTAALSFSLVLLLQAALFGEGGMTSLPVNALAMGFLGALAAVAVHRGLRRAAPRAALFLAGWLSVAVPAAAVAVVLGIQPSIARRPDGTPLFFPFGLEVTLPAIVLPHLALGVGEGILTVLVVGLFERAAAKDAPLP